MDSFLHNLCYFTSGGDEANAEDDNRDSEDDHVVTTVGDVVSEVCQDVMGYENV